MQGQVGCVAQVRFPPSGDGPLPTHCGRYMGLVLGASKKAPLMKTLPVDTNLFITSDAEGGFRHGEIFHVERNADGGTLNTPIGRYFTTKPNIEVEGYHPHSRIDCFVREHELAPAEEWLTRRLSDVLLKNAIVEEPLWISWHRAKEIGGEARGEVFDFD